MSRMLLSLLLSLSALVPLHLAHAADLKPEERLQAIRQAMVDAAMSSHTRVSATSCCHCSAAPAARRGRSRTWQEGAAQQWAGK